MEGRSLGQSLYDVLSETELAITQEGFAEGNVQTAKIDGPMDRRRRSQPLECMMRESCGRSVFSQLVAQLSLESYDQQRHSFKEFVESNTVNFVVNERVKRESKWTQRTWWSKATHLS